MSWTMAAVKANPSTARLPLAEIPQDVKDSVDEAYSYCQANPLERLVVPFETTEARDEARGHIRSYCEVRPAGRLTASIWAGFSGMKGEGEGQALVFSQSETDTCKSPSLSLFFKKYEKRDNSQAAQAAPAAPAA